MKFTCTQENLSQALDVVTPITGKNLSLPILNNILLKASDSDITLQSTNLEIGMTSRIRGKVESAGGITLNGKLFRDFVSLQPSGNIHVELKETNIHIHSSSSKTVIKGIAADEFPLIPTLDDKKTAVPMDVETLKTALQPITPTVTLNESRPEISGVLFQFSGNLMTLAGTDSYRLAEFTLPLPGGKAEGAYILPLRTIQEMTRVFADQKIELAFSENQFLCQSENTELISRLIEGNYPDYKQIIPQEEKTTISVHRDEFVQAVKTASLFCKSGVNDVEISTKKEEKLLVVVAANNQVGENITTIPSVVTGEDTSIIFNYRYVLDALGTIPTDDVIISFSGPNTTGVFRPTDETKLIHLIMPIRQ